MSHHNFMEWDNRPLQTQPKGARRAPTVGQTSVVSRPLQESKMASPGGQNCGFIDLSVLRGNNNLQPNVVKNSVQPSEDVSQSFTSLGQRKAFLIARPTALTPTQGLPNILPVPTFGSDEKFSVTEKEALPLQQKQPSKTFIDGPPLPVFEDKVKEFGIELRKDKAFDFGYDLKLEVSQPATKYRQGEIKYTTKGALKEMLQDLARLRHGTTGCIIDETCDPECNDYIEGTHFLSDELIGHGSYGKVDLCYDSKTERKFVRKQLSKKALRTSEIIVPTTLNHYNITKFYGLIQREGKEEGNPTMELLIEYAGCALNKYFIDGNSLTHAQIWDLSKQGLEALAHISHYSIVHLDVKPENICVTLTRNGSLLLKLTDFGSSRLPQEPLKFVGLTPEYMAPEICKMFLQTQGNGLNWGLTEADITGKVDTFAFGLVIMYLYKGYHILVKVINQGKPTYEGLDMQTRKLLHMQLMTQMADDSSGTSFVQNFIPDECDLEMRNVLIKLTEHKHQDRWSARQGLEFIERKEQGSKLSVRQEQKVKDAVDQQYIQKHVPVIALDSCTEMEIPGIAEDCMESDNGPVKNRTKDALRMKLQPYGKPGKKGKNSKNLNSKTISARVSVSEMRELRQGIASKQIQIPNTPVLEFKELSLGQCLPEELFEVDNKSSATMTERNAPVAQPSMDTHPYPVRVSQPVVPGLGFSGVSPLHPVEPVPGFINANPYSSVQPENNVVSLGGKGIPSTVNVHQTGMGALSLETPLGQALVQMWLQKKLMAVQTKVKTEPNVHPHVINIADQIPAVNREQIVKVGQTKNVSLVQMDEEEDIGNLPKFSAFS